MYEQKEPKQSNQIITLSMCKSESREGGGASGIYLQKEFIEFFHNFFFLGEPLWASKENWIQWEELELKLWRKLQSSIYLCIRGVCIFVIPCNQ